MSPVSLSPATEALSHLGGAVAAMREARRSFPVATDLFPCEPLTEVERKSIALNLSLIEAHAASLRAQIANTEQAA